MPSATRTLWMMALVCTPAGCGLNPFPELPWGGDEAEDASSPPTFTPSGGTGAGATAGSGSGAVGGTGGSGGTAPGTGGTISAGGSGNPGTGGSMASGGLSAMGGSSFAGGAGSGFSGGAGAGSGFAGSFPVGGGSGGPPTAGFGGDAGTSSSAGTAGTGLAEQQGSCNIPATFSCSEVTDSPELIAFFAGRCMELGGAWSNGPCPVTSALVGCCRQGGDAACYYAAVIEGMPAQSLCTGDGAVWDPAAS